MFKCLMFHYLSDMFCFQGLMFCPEACSLLLHNFCVYHISPPGHEVCIIGIVLYLSLSLFFFFDVLGCFLHRIDYKAK